MNLNKEQQAKIEEIIPMLTSEINDRKVDFATRAELRNKRDYLMKLSAESIPNEPSIFISYSSGSGREYFEKAAGFFEKKGVQVQTGFDQRVVTERLLFPAIQKAIADCSMFLGIWSADYSVTKLGHEFQGKTIPGPWVTEEKSMAAFYRRPWRLLVESTIDDDFYTKTTGSKPQLKFGLTDFLEQLNLAHFALFKEHHELMARLEGEG